MNEKFRKLLSGIISSVGVMSSLVCPCAQAKWGEGTHAMTDEEFNEFYKNKVGLDAFKYAKNHDLLKDLKYTKQIDECVDDFDRKNNLNDASSFLEHMKKYCEYYQSSIGKKGQFSNCRVFSFMAMDYFQRKNIKSAYLQIGSYAFDSGSSHDVVVYEGKNNEWFVADLDFFFYLCNIRFNIKEVRKDFELIYGFKSDNAKYILQFPLRDYIKIYAKTYNNYIIATENSGEGGYRGLRISDGGIILLPYWVKTSGACSKSFMDKFRINEGVNDLDLFFNSPKLKFIAPQKIVKKPGTEGLGMFRDFAVYKGINGEEVPLPVV